MAAVEESLEPWALRDPIREGAFLESVMNLLLLYHPHSCAASLKRNPGPAPRDVKRVIDYIEAHLEHDVTLADLVVQAGVPGRTLNEHFRVFAGEPPMAYLRLRRLEAARRALQSGEEISVTQVALRFGFNSLGRFAGVYRRAFGESPRETLKLGR